MPKVDLGSLAAKLVSKVIPERVLGGKTLEQQVAMVHKAIGFMAGIPHSSVEKATVKVRSDILKGLPDDIKKMVKEGMDIDDIKAYYWDCEAFRDLWVNTFKMEEATFDGLVVNTLTGGNR